MAILAVQLICFKSSSSTKTQHGSVVNKFALPPAARRISSAPQPISLATCMTASSSPTSPSSSSVTQTSFMPSASSIRASSSLITWPLASNFLPPARNIVQQRTLPVDSITSMVFAFIDPEILSGLGGPCSNGHDTSTVSEGRPGFNWGDSVGLFFESGWYYSYD